MMEKEAYSEGHEARLSGESETANPYDPDDQFDEHTAWNDGWADAHEDLQDEDDLTGEDED